MQFKSLLKGSALIFSLLALAACSSTTTEDEPTVTNDPAVVEPTDPVETDVAPGVIEPTAEELRQAELDALMAENVLYFDYDESGIRSEFTDLLEKHASFLRDNPSQSVLIEGHADERGTPEYNIALGERRANAVSSYLQSMGVENSQITTVSYGEEKPADMGHDEDAFSLNRRAVIVY